MIKTHLQKIFSKRFCFKNLSKSTAYAVELFLTKTRQATSFNPILVYYSKFMREDLIPVSRPTPLVFHSRGLRDVLDTPSQKSTKMFTTYGRSGIDNESYVHALSFSKEEIETSSFKLDDVETTVSQTLENVSACYSNA